MDPKQPKKRHIDVHAADMVNIISYVTYGNNTFFLHLDYVPYPKHSLKSMTNDMYVWKQLHLQKI